jgi:hypothetical protein
MLLRLIDFMHVGVAGCAVKQATWTTVVKKISTIDFATGMVNLMLRLIRTDLLFAVW